MKNSHLLIASPALSSVNRDMTDILNQDMDRLMQRGRRLRSEAAHHAIQFIATWLVRGIKAVKTALLQGHQRRVSIRQLYALDDHTLRDIGLSRAEIYGAVDGLFRLSKHDAEDSAPAIRELGHTIGPVAAAEELACNDHTAVKVVNVR